MNRGNLLLLRPGSGERSLVFLHPAGGSAGGFRRLLPHLDPTLTVAAFQAGEPGPDDRCSIPAVAEDYLEELTETIPVTGAVLAGWSFGGAVAVEMARMAEQELAPPEAVILLDSATPVVLGERPRSPSGELAALFGVDATAVSGAESWESALEAIADALNEASRQVPVSPDELCPFAETYQWHLKASRAPWSGLPCAARVTLIRAADERGWAGCPDDLGWSAVFGRPIEPQWTPGTHHSLTDPANASALADRINSILTGLSACA
ncbi:alpha/beta fold hydrolase [[Kitasatospora] papulosa]|uniref:thioesterase domain-containing protein n=1 Tax=[Kitasatospora] papulosa TaxID=1464011 RepID=UPI0036765612